MLNAVNFRKTVDDLLSTALKLEKLLTFNAVKFLLSDEGQSWTVSLFKECTRLFCGIDQVMYCPPIKPSTKVCHPPPVRYREWTKPGWFPYLCEEPSLQIKSFPFCLVVSTAQLYCKEIAPNTNQQLLCGTVTSEA
jgi:hypothetical protein